MKRTSLVTAAVALTAALMAPARSEAQLPRDPAERAKVIAQILEANARQLTVFDRKGQQVSVVDRATCTTSRSSRLTPAAWP